MATCDTGSKSLRRAVDGLSGSTLTLKKSLHQQAHQGCGNGSFAESIHRRKRSHN
jgi:hypothetical protein